MINFAQPLWIIAGLCTMLLFWLLMYRIAARKKERLESFASPVLLPGLMPNVSTTRRRVKNSLLLLAVFCCFVALARPQYGHRWIDVKHKGIDILFALDCSKSMLAEDILPNRLERSKLAVMDFVSQLNGDRVGLLPFAGGAYLVYPLTSDYHAFEQSLMAVDTTIIPAGGTDIGNALHSAEKILKNEANHKILVLITDGEDLEGQAIKTAAEAKKHNVTVFTVGIGTTQGELIPDKEHGGFKKDDQGSYVKSRLDETSLRTIAESTGGIYVPLGNKGQGLETIYQEKLALIPKTEFAEKRKKVPVERFRWPLAAALILLSVEFLISGRKPNRSLPSVLSHLAKRNKKTLVALPFLFWVAGTISPVSALELQDAYSKGEYVKAAEQYKTLLEKDPENPKLLYNSGTAAYKNNLFGEAADAFQKSLGTDDVDLQQKAYYNLGNTLYRKGEQMQQSEPKKAIEAWEQALKCYQAARTLNEDNQNAQFNHDLVSHKLEQLKQQQNSKQQDQDQSDQQNQDKNQQDNNTPDPGDEHNNEHQKLESPDKNGTPDERKKSPEQDETNQQEQPDTDSDQENNQATPASPTEDRNSNNLNQSQPAVSGQETHEMTRGEAEKLLQAVQDEEGRLNLYMPAQQKKTKSHKDW